MLALWVLPFGGGDSAWTQKYISDIMAASDEVRVLGTEDEGRDASAAVTTGGILKRGTLWSHTESGECWPGAFQAEGRDCSQGPGLWCVENGVPQVSLFPPEDKMPPSCCRGDPAVSVGRCLTAIWSMQGVLSQRGRSELWPQFTTGHVP